MLVVPVRPFAKLSAAALFLNVPTSVAPPLFASLPFCVSGSGIISLKSYTLSRVSKVPTSSSTATTFTFSGSNSSLLIKTVSPSLGILTVSVSSSSSSSSSAVSST